jgi:hypothetical protein
MRTSTRKVELLKYTVYVSQADIDGGECCDANRCMVRVANERKLRLDDPSMTNHHSRVDAGHIRFNYKGYRWMADTARIAKANLILFDKERRQKTKAKRKGQSFQSKVEPFAFTVIAERKGKIKPTTPKRKEQINTARRKRAEEGQKPKRYTLHQRVVGFA